MKLLEEKPIQMMSDACLPVGRNFFVAAPYSGKLTSDSLNSLYGIAKNAEEIGLYKFSNKF